MSTATLAAPTRGPILWVFEICMSLVFVSLSAWLLGVAIEIVGGYLVWPDEAELHARRMVEQDLGYIEAAPRSVLVGDTVALSNELLRWVQKPYASLGIVALYMRLHHPDGSEPGSVPIVSPAAGLSGFRGLGDLLQIVVREGARCAVISMYVAMDVVLRLAIAVFAIPAFVLACLLGAVDGLVRRDLRRWRGGRESSFIYHHAKRYTRWSLTGGFGLYLAWPFGGFNPAYMVLVFTVLVAMSLSTTLAAFKKYL
ncbi:MAG: DUF4400 domain-containing protein [Gammaproteobacteria bacterium]|uniref:DUF4400 domain-containing protein n=1 Tax=uncultured Pseudacidovorax sp. TaxID=679313 RepID=UPI0025FFB8D6|nr:DUF4400 domain-containing protein [uncultured Pseudacidovorax sp.]